jgi:hypothetical protein
MLVVLGITPLHHLAPSRLLLAVQQAKCLLLLAVAVVGLVGMLAAVAQAAWFKRLLLD